MKDIRKHDETKLLWHMDRVIEHFDEGKRIVPVHIDMGLSKFCNVACRFCYGLFQETAPVYIQRDALFDFMRDAGALKIRSVSLIGDGEPTCNPHFYDALRIGKESGLSLATSTNGVLLNTPERRKAILDTCDWMKFTICAGTREGYKYIHKRDKFDVVVSNIEKMVTENTACDIGMNAIFVPAMAREMVEEAKLAIRLGVNYLLIKQCSLPDKGQSGMMQFDLNDYDKPEIVSALKEAESMSTDKTQIIVKWGLIQQKGVKNYAHCPAAPVILEISGNGDVYPCGHMFGNKPQFAEYKMGNLHETRISDIIHSERYWEIIRKMRYDFDVQKQCHGNCRMDRINEFLTNYLDTPKGRDFI